MKRLKIITSLFVITSSIILSSTVAYAGEWIKSGNDWKYLKDNSSYAIGWVKDNDKWYYMNSNGIMQTGWIYDTGNWYYTYSDGRMAHDTTIDGYHLSSTGAWSTSGNSLDSRKVSGGTVGNDQTNAQRIGNQNGYSQQASDASQYPANDPRSRGPQGQVSTSSDGTLSQNMQRSEQSQNTNSSDPFAPISGTAGNDPTNAQKMGNENQ